MIPNYLPVIGQTNISLSEGIRRLQHPLQLAILVFVWIGSPAYQRTRHKSDTTEIESLEVAKICKW
jgi:hypothetical protein